MGADAIVCFAGGRCRAAGAASAQAVLPRAGITLQGRVAPYFLCLGKESRQRKPRPRFRPLRGCPVLLARSGGHRNSHDLAPAARATCFGQSMAESPGPHCAARRLRGQNCVALASGCAASERRRCASARGRRGGAGRQRSSAGRVSERPQGASFAHGPLTPCSAREAGASAQAGLARSPFFGYFLWRSKESNRPRAVSGRSSKNDDARRAAALNVFAARRAIDRSC